MLLGVYGYISAQRELQQRGINDLDWQGVHISSEGLHLNQLSLSQHDSNGRVLQLQVDQLDLSWQQFSTLPPFWQHIRVAQLTLDWQPGTPQSPAEPDAPLDLQQLSDIAAQLPAQIQIDQLNASLPCVSGRCTLLGDATLTKQGSTPQLLQLQLNLRKPEQRLAIGAALKLSSEALDGQLAILANDEAQLGLNATLSNTTDGVTLSGNLSAPNLNQAAALQGWLSAWALPAASTLPMAPSAATLAANWQLHAPSLSELAHATGHIAAQANLPEAWPVPGIGQLQGTLAVGANGTEQGWLVQQLEANLNLQQPAPELLANLPEALHVKTLTLRIEPIPALAQLPESLVGRSLPLNIVLTGTGISNIDVQAKIAIANALPWALHVSAASIKASTPTYKIAGLNLSKLNAELQLNGYADAERIALNLDKHSSLSATQLSSPQIKMKQLEITSDALQFSASLQGTNLTNIQFQGPVNLSSTRVEQAQLNTLGWNWQGSLQATAAEDISQLHATLNGTLTADSGLQLPAQINYDAKGLRIKAQLPEIFLRAGNPLAKTFKDWPALLELTQGKIKAAAEFNQPPGNTALKASVNLTASGISGIYDRTAVTGLDTRTRIDINGTNLQLNLDSLSIEEANPGIPVGPIQLRGSYNAKLTAAGAGTLKLHQIQAGLLGGNVSIAPAQWQLNQNQWLLPVTITGLKLQTLFALYPAEGLAGSGLIDGVLPVRVSRQGLHIEQGQVNARAPGGRLRFDNEKIKALGQSNPAMQLVAQSLEDFHYTVLSSDVNYDEQGKLRLGLRLEGQNPAIENGRAINFNINLEENIPTLLASLQLSDKVSEIIQRRVQQFILQRNSKTSPSKSP